MEKTWKVEFSDKALKELRKLGAQTQKMVLEFFKDKISNSSDPKQFGKPLLGNLSGLWRYRVGKYRVICEIQNNKLTILVLKLGHRASIYD